MAVALYMDHNVDRAVTDGLRLRGVDVLTAYQDDMHETDDPELLDRATDLGRVLFSTDADLLVEARRRQRIGERFEGIVFARQSRVGIGTQIDDLEVIAKAADPAEVANRVLFLPLR